MIEQSFRSIASKLLEELITHTFYGTADGQTDGRNNGQGKMPLSVVTGT